MFRGRSVVAVTLLLVSVLTLLLTEPAPVHAQATLVQYIDNNICAYGCSGYFNTLPQTIGASFSSSVTAGDVVIVAVATESGPVTTATDSLGSSYTSAQFEEDSYGNTVQLFYATLSSSGTDTITVHFPSAPDALELYAYEVRGVSTFGFTTVVGSGGYGTSVQTSSSASFPDGAFLLGVETNNAPASAQQGSGFILSPQASYSGAEYSVSGVSSPTNFPFTLSSSAYWCEAGIVLEPLVSTAVMSTVTASASTTSSASITPATETIPFSSSLSTVVGSPSFTNTISVTSTTTGAVAGTGTTTFISPVSTSYSTDFSSSSLVGSSTSFTQTGTTTTGTSSLETTTSTASVFSTTISGGTVTLTETDTYYVLLTQILQELEQFEAFVLQTLGFQVTATPVGQQVNQVVVTQVPTTSTTVSSTQTVTQTSTLVGTFTSSTSSTVTAPAVSVSLTLSPIVTGTVSTTVTKTGYPTGTFTATYTQLVSTSTSTSVSTFSAFTTGSETFQTTTSTTGTVTSSSTSFSTTTSSGTVQVTQKDIFTEIITTIVQVLHQILVGILTGFRTIVTVFKTPVGRIVHRVTVVK